jgi:Transposase
MQEVEDEPLFAERVAGIDIGKKEIMVTIRVPSDTRKGRRQQETREFRTTRADLLELADWLRCCQVTKAGMEATDDYWKPVFFLLEREGFDRTLYHASQVKALPGRPKTDKLDSVWLAKITERGALPGSFVPPGRHPAAAHPYPLPQAPGPGPHRREGTLREAPGRRPSQALQRDQRHPRGGRPGHADRDHRRGTQP